MRRLVGAVMALLIAGSILRLPGGASAQSGQIDYNKFVTAVADDPLGGQLLVKYLSGGPSPSDPWQGTFISSVDLNTRQVLRTIPDPGGDMVIDPQARVAFLGPTANRTIERLDMASGHQTTLLQLPPEANGGSLLLDTVARTLYLATPTNDTNSLTLAIDISSASITARLPYEVKAINPRLGRLYALEYFRAPATPEAVGFRLLALDAGTNSPVAGNSIVEVPGQAYLRSLQVNTGTGRLYLIAASGIAKIGFPVLYVVDGQTNQIIHQGNSPVESFTYLNEAENKLYGPALFYLNDETLLVGGEDLAVLGRWRLPGRILGSDPLFQVVIAAPNVGMKNTLIYLLDARVDTYQRTITVVPASQPQPEVQPTPPFANTSEAAYFPETGHSLHFGFKYYWEHNGGLASFGYPLTEEFQEYDPAEHKSFTVQYFERARFEYHPEFAGTPYETELGLLGRQFAAWRAPGPVGGTSDQVAFFPETGQFLSFGFKYYWEHNGGLARFGFPITGEFVEISPTDGQPYTVQYFERTRFEYHPEFKGTPFETELGLLGRQALNIKGWR